MASNRHNTLSDTTNVMNIIVTIIIYCAGLSLRGLRCVKIHAQVLHEAWYVDSLLSSLKITSIFLLIQLLISAKQASSLVERSARISFDIIASHFHQVSLYQQSSSSLYAVSRSSEITTLFRTRRCSVHFNVAFISIVLIRQR